MPFPFNRCAPIHLKKWASGMRPNANRKAMGMDVEMEMETGMEMEMGMGMEMGIRRWIMDLHN